MESKLVHVGIMTLSMGNFVTAIDLESWKANNIYDQRTLKAYLIAWLSLQAGADIIVTGTLSYALYCARTGYGRTDNVIYRLIRGAVQTGLFTCIFAMGHLAAFLISPDTQVYAFFAGSTGRMYSIMSADTLKSLRLNSDSFQTLIDTLHSRDQLRDALSGTMDVNSSIIRTPNGHSSSDHPEIFQLSTVNTCRDVLSESRPNTKLGPG
ncbi:hypothetical protein DFS33DRAFT_1384285 [Desarmillaria ectypa]|nr:hypothetical protein DFS33DRAFT_1384285 [Desarmillaria ectypa]